MSKSAKIWLSKSIFYVKNYTNLSQKFFHLRISIEAHFCFWHFLITSIFKSLYLVEWCPIFDNSPLTQFSKFNNFLWVCWFLGKNLSNFVPPAWKLNNPYSHNMYSHNNCLIFRTVPQFKLSHEHKKRQQFSVYKPEEEKKQMLRSQSETQKYYFFVNPIIIHLPIKKKN